jgi:hypothetical protein
MSICFVPDNETLTSNNPKSTNIVGNIPTSTPIGSVEVNNTNPSFTIKGKSKPGGGYGK